MKHALNFLICFICIACQSSEGGALTNLKGIQLEHEALNATITNAMTQAQVTGLGVSVFNKNEVYTTTFGLKNAEAAKPLNNQTVFAAASLSKAVFAYLVGQLVIDGVVDLDKPLQDYLDFPLYELKKESKRQSFAALKTDERYKQLTARMCLNHTTGFPNWRWMTRENDFMPEGEIRFLINPGERYYYSGEGFQLLQFVIEAITQKSLEQLAQALVFQPLQMSATSYVWQDEFAQNCAVGHNSKGGPLPLRKRTTTNAAGSLVTTIEDYTKFLQHLLDLSEQKSPITKLLFTPSIRITSKTQFGYQAWENTTDNDAIALSYGLGFGVMTTPSGKAVFKEGHDNGYQHYFILFPEKQIAVLLMSNSDNAESTFKTLLEASIGDVYTPWQWQRYIPYNFQQPS